MALQTYKYNTSVNGLAAETVYDAKTNKAFSSGDEFLKAGGDWNSIETRQAPPVVPVNIAPSTRTTSAVFAKPAKTNADLQALILENQKMQQQYLQTAMTPDKNIQKVQQDLYGLQNQARNTQLNADAGIAATKQRVVPMEFIRGEQVGIADQANIALRTNALQQQPLVQQLETLSANRNQLLKAQELAISFGKEDLSLRMQLDKISREEQLSAKDFALQNMVQQPFYTIDGTTIYRTSDGKAYSNYEDWAKDGGKPELVQNVSAQQSMKGLPVSYQEYLLAKQEGFAGSYNDYQTADANRKRSTSTTINNIGNDTKEFDLMVKQAPARVGQLKTEGRNWGEIAAYFEGLGIDPGTPEIDDALHRSFMDQKEYKRWKEAQ